MAMEDNTGEEAPRDATRRACEKDAVVNMGTETASSEDSHEAIWASMQTVVVRESIQQSSPPKPSLLVEDSSDSGDDDDSAEDNIIGIIDGDSKSTGSSTPDSGGSPTCVEIDTNRTGSNRRGEEDEALAFSDLFGMSDVMTPSLPADLQASFEKIGNDATLPSVKEAQQQLDDIVTRRNDIKAMSARYFPLQSDNKADREPIGDTEVMLQKTTCFESDLPSATLAAPKKSPISSKSTPAKACGPYFKPDSAQVSDVMQQLAGHLRQLSANSKGPTSLPKEAPSALQKATSACNPQVGTAPKSENATGGFTIGGRSTGTISTSSNPGELTAVDCVVGKAGRQGGLKVSVDQNRLRAAREQEDSRTEELWQQFLAGDDLPVGDDGLPPPELYFKGIV